MKQKENYMTCQVKLIGSLEEVNCSDFSAFANAYKFYRSVNPEITKEEIDSFSKKFRFSDEETEEVLKYYQKLN